MLGILTLVNRLVAPFKSSEFECSESRREVQRQQAELNKKLDRLEQEISRAQLDGEDRWLLVSRRRNE